MSRTLRLFVPRGCAQRLRKLSVYGTQHDPEALWQHAFTAISITTEHAQDYGRSSLLPESRLLDTTYVTSMTVVVNFCQYVYDQLPLLSQRLKR